MAKRNLNQNFYRFPWKSFPEVLIHSPEQSVRSDEAYVAAKTGDSEAAYRLAHRFIDDAILRKMEKFSDSTEITLASAHALERNGVNAIPEALAEVIGGRLGWPVEHQIVQVNIVSHTKADGFARLARQAEFGGDVDPGRAYFLVDDFVGQGGTLANLRGWIMHLGGRVVGATVLTGKAYSARLSVDQFQIDELTNKHQKELREWWNDRFAFDYDCLTSSEARYLIRTPSADRIRNRIIEAVEERGGN